MDILSLLACFQTLTTATTIRRLNLISQAILSMSGRVTQLSISRWTEKGGSYRTVQRFFAAQLPWASILCKFFETHLFNPKHEYLLAGDATTVTKAGSQTFGVGLFFLEFWAKPFAA